MSDIRETLDQLKAACEAATDGPWKAGTQRLGDHAPDEVVMGPGIDLYDSPKICTSDDWGDAEAEGANMAFIALSRTALPVLADALERVLAYCDRPTYHPQPYMQAGMSAAKGIVSSVIFDALAPLSETKTTKDTSPEALDAEMDAEEARMRELLDFFGCDRLCIAGRLLKCEHLRPCNGCALPVGVECVKPEGD